MGVSADCRCERPVITSFTVLFVASSQQSELCINEDLLIRILHTAQEFSYKLKHVRTTYNFQAFREPSRLVYVVLSAV